MKYLTPIHLPRSWRETTFPVIPCLPGGTPARAGERDFRVPLRLQARPPDRHGCHSGYLPPMEGAPQTLHASTVWGD
jgi:hypothetical protein